MAVQPCMEWIPTKKEKEKKAGTWKRKRKRDLTVKENNIRLSPLPFHCNIEKTKIMIYYVKFVSWAYISLVFLIYFICEYMSQLWTDKSEALGKLSKHPNHWWKCPAGEEYCGG